MIARTGYSKKLTASMFGSPKSKKKYNRARSSYTSKRYKLTNKMGDMMNQKMKHKSRIFQSYKVDSKPINRSRNPRKGSHKISKPSSSNYQRTRLRKKSSQIFNPDKIQSNGGNKSAVVTTHRSKESSNARSNSRSLINHYKFYNEKALGFVPPSTVFDEKKFNLDKDCSLYLGKYISKFNKMMHACYGQVKYQ
jgi:hypothetical protein